MNPGGHYIRLTDDPMKSITLILVLFLAVAASAATLHFQGAVVAVAEDKVALETADGSILHLLVKAQSRITEKGKVIKLGQLREGDRLDVDVIQDAKGSFTIVEAKLMTRTAVDEEAGPPKLRRRTGTEAPSATSRANTERENRKVVDE